MKKKYLKLSILICSALAFDCATVGCGRSDAHDHASEAHEGHDHENEGHAHEGEDHDHDEHEEDGSHEGHDHSGLIEMNETTARRFGVVTEKIDPADFSDITVVAGRIESKASDEGVATATRNGILTISPHINAGVRVGAGSPIGVISASNVQGGDPTVQAVAVRNAAKRELDRLKPLHDDGIVSTE